MRKHGSAPPQGFTRARLENDAFQGFRAFQDLKVYECCTRAAETRVAGYSAAPGTYLEPIAS
eukprot:1988484-Pyramimonas_sp.AAC.1